MSRDKLETWEVPRIRPRTFYLIDGVLIDNNAKDAWRHGKETMLIRKHFVRLQPGAEALFHHNPESNKKRQIDKISGLTETHIVVCPPQDSQLFGLEIWGTVEKIREAENSVFKWIEESFSVDARTEKRNRKFPRVQPLKQEHLDIVYEKLEEHGKRLRFKRSPPRDHEFSFQEIFTWPTGNPTVALGRNLEALDLIRMECLCYITPEGTQITCKSDDPESVKKALRAVEATYFQVDAQQTSSVHPKYFSKVPANDCLKTPIDLIDIHETQTDEEKCVRIPTLPLYVLSALSLDAVYHDALIMEEEIEKCFSRLSYVRGHVSMRARLGRFVLSEYDSSIKTLGDLKEMVEDPEFHSRVDHGIQGIDLIDLNDRLYGSGDWLIPIQDEHGVEASVTKLEHRVTYVLRESQDSRYYQLNAVWSLNNQCTRKCTPDSNDLWRPDRIELFELHHNTGKKQYLLDLRLANLVSGNAWKLEIASAPSVPFKRKHAIEMFAETLKLNLIAAQTGTGCSTIHISKPDESLHIESIIQEKVRFFSFDVAPVQYHLELSNVQELVFDFDTIDLTLRRKGQQQISVSVFNVDWPRTFSQNADLPIGRGVSYAASMTTFFPSPEAPLITILGDTSNESFDKFLKILSIVEQVIMDGFVDMDPLARRFEDLS